MKISRLLSQRSVFFHRIVRSARMNLPSDAEIYRPRRNRRKPKRSLPRRLSGVALNASEATESAFSLCHTVPHGWRQVFHARFELGDFGVLRGVCGERM